MIEIIGACILFSVAVFAFIASGRAFKEKGFLFNNVYLYATEQEREKMNKKPYYRQSAIVFLSIGLMFLLNGFGILFHTDWIFYIVITIVIITLIYAIISSIVIGKNNSRQ